MTELNLTQSDNFQKLIQDLYAETRIDERGRGTMTMRGVARFLTIKESSLQNHFSCARIGKSKLVKRLQGMGFEVLSFSVSGVPDAAIGIIANYFSKNHAASVIERADFLASLGARTFLQKIKGWEEPKVEDPNPFSNIGYALDSVLAPLRIKPELQAGIRAEAIAAQYPDLRPAIEATKKHLLLETKSELLSPTALGNLLEIPVSARKINGLLIEAGLQEKTGNRACPYIAKGRGLDHSELVADTAKGHAKTVQKLRWYKTVLELI